jgi:type IV pilus assembly protein PilC
MRMPAFEYSGRDRVGSLVRGVLEADDESRARARLREQGLYVTALRPRRQWSLGARRDRPVTSEDVAAFTFSLSGLLSSGVPLLRGIEILRDQSESDSMQRLLTDLVNSIQEGRSLSMALDRHPQVFSPFYVALVRTGEIAGVLDQTLARLSDHLDRELALRQKIRAMLVYPMFVFTLATIVAGVFLVFVVPVFERVYRSAGASLPLLTRGLIGLSHLLREFWPLVLVAGGLAAWGSTRPSVQRIVRAMSHRLVASIPRLRLLAHTIQINRFVRSFGALQASGIPVMSALDATSDALSDVKMRDAITHLKDAIDNGRRLSEAMRSAEVFPPMVQRMVALGEESGRLDLMLDRASLLLERETDFAIRRLVTLAEPVLTLALGGMVAFVLLALYLPIFGLPKALLR